MEFSTLRSSFSISISLDADKAANVAAIAVGKAVRNATKSILESAIANARSAISAERTAKDAIWNVISTTAQITEAVIHSTDVRVKTVIEEKAIAPAMQAKAAITIPTHKAWNMALDGITDYLESTPIKTAEVAESFPIQLAQLEEAIADYTKIEEVEVDAAKVDPIPSENEINAALAEEKPQVIGGAIVSSAGVTNAIAFDGVTLGKGHKAPPNLNKMIKEEAAKHKA